MAGNLHRSRAICKVLRSVLLHGYWASTPPHCELDSELGMVCLRICASPLSDESAAYVENHACLIFDIVLINILYSGN
jgi:hypothetical protein